MDGNALAGRFTTGALLRFAVPNIGMMLFLALYTIADGIFVSRLVGTLALSSLNMSWPLLGAELALAMMLSTGGSAVIARKQGAGQEQEAREAFTFFLWAGTAVSVVLALVSLWQLDPILRFLGTSPEQMMDCMVYTRICLWFLPAMFLQILFQTGFVTAGKPGLGLCVTVSGGLGNVVLDALLMGPAHLGLAGAAVATGVSSLLPAAFGLLYFWRMRTGTLCLVPFHACWRMLWMACCNGLSELVSSWANAATTFLCNLLLMAWWAEDGVAAITMVLYVQYLFSAVFTGFSLGVAPVISYQYGTGDRRQLRSTVKRCIRFILLCSLCVFLATLAVIRPLLSLFAEPESTAYRITLQGFSWYAAAFLPMGLNIFAASLFTALSNGRVSAGISCCRTFLFPVCMLLLLPHLLGKWAVWLAIPAAEMLGLAVTVFCLHHWLERGFSQGFPQC